MEEKKKISVYIASPYTKGDVAVNVKAQIDCVDELLDLGFVPFAPLYSHFQHIVHPRPHQDWLDIDFYWVKVCDCLLRLPGESVGADEEVRLALHLKKPVFDSIEKMVNYYEKGDCAGMIIGLGPFKLGTDEYGDYFSFKVE